MGGEAVSPIDPKSNAGRVLLVLWATPAPLSLGEVAATAWPLALPQYDQPATRQFRMRLRGENVDRVRSYGGELVLKGYATIPLPGHLWITPAGIALVESWRGEA